MEKLKLNELESTVKSSYRTLALFEFFAEIQRPATVAEISKGLQIPQSSTSGILKSLHDTSFLSFDPAHRTYEPTMRMAFLSNWMVQKNKQASKFPNLLKNIRDDIQETTVLAVRNGIYSQYIFVEHFDALLGRHVETGSVRPLISSATGWSLLQDDSDDDIRKIIQRTAHEIKDSVWLHDPEATFQNIKIAREKGYAVSKGDMAKGAAGIAVNLPSHKGGPQLSIAVAGPKNRILSREKIISARLKTVIADLPATITQDIIGLR